MTSNGNPPCKAGLIIMGEFFPCQQMEQMVPGSTDHKGWAHSNRDAEAIWVGNEGSPTSNNTKEHAGAQ